MLSNRLRWFGWGRWILGLWILGLFLLALPERPDPRASLVGLVCGLVSVGCVVFLLPYLDIALAWPWRGVVTGGVTFVAGALARSLSPT